MTKASKKPVESLGDRLKAVADAVLEALDGLLSPPTPAPIPVRTTYPKRRRRPMR